MLRTKKKKEKENMVEYEYSGCRFRLCAALTKLVYSSSSYVNVSRTVQPACKIIKLRDTTSPRDSPTFRSASSAAPWILK